MGSEQRLTVMEASIDIELIAHLGEFRNIDLSQKGIYAVELGLYYGAVAPSKKIVPVGLFSAPSTLDSYVDGQKVFHSA